MLNDRGIAACRLSEFQDAFNDLDTAGKPWFAYWLSELVLTACQAETAQR